MEDVTDVSFRVLCKEQGAAMVYTEFVPSDGLIRDAAKAIAKMHTLPEEAPVGIQIYGHIPESMVDAARMADHAAEIAGGHGADLIDINFGCPVSKIAGRGAGSGMMREPDKMVAITKAVVEAVNKPVTVKTRLGWDDNSKIIVELAERLQDVGIQALTIHGRTRQQMYKGLPRGVFEMRRHLSCYFKGLPDFKQTRMRLVTTTDPAEIVNILDYINETWADVPLEASNVYDI